MKKIGVLTSGGDAPGMNPAIRSVVRCAIDCGCEVYGYIGGYQGLIDNKFVKLNSRDVGNIIYKGGTFLKTSRCEEFKTNAGIKKAIDNLKKENISSLVIIGGDGSLKGAIELEKNDITVSFIPATIDNDLYYTERSLGFDTACNTIVNLINNLRDTSLSHDRIFVVEVMGANCGDLAICAGLASGAENIIIPEEKINIDHICENLTNSIRKGKQSSIIFVNEKVMGAESLAKLIKQKINKDVRYVVIGHIQRGGNPSFMDRFLGTILGNEAVHLALLGKSGAVGVKGYEAISMSLESASKFKKKVKKELLEIARVVSK